MLANEKRRNAIGMVSKILSLYFWLPNKNRASKSPTAIITATPAKILPISMYFQEIFLSCPKVVMSSVTAITKDTNAVIVSMICKRFGMRMLLG